MNEDARKTLTALSIGRSAGLLVDEMCTCGGQQARRVWRMPGDLRNRHRESCPAIAALSRLGAVEDEARDETARLLGYLWTAEGKIDGRPVCDLFDDDDPIVADIERLAIFPESDHKELRT